MAWLKTRKSMPISGLKSATLPSGGVTSPSFPLPRLPKDIAFNPLEFFLAVGLGVTRHKAPSRVSISMALASCVVMSQYVKNRGTSFKLSKTIEQINETKINAIGHDLGVAVTMLTMQKMGYRWSAIAEDLIKVPVGEKCPDFLFDHGRRHWRAELVAVEAKGCSSPKQYAEASFKRTVQRAAKIQAGALVGKQTTAGILISHGYGVGCFAPRGGSPAAVLVCELEASVPATHSGLGTTAEGSGDCSSPSLSVAASHYKSAFRLMGYDSLCRELRSQLRQRLRLASRRNQFRVIRFYGADYVVSRWAVPEDLNHSLRSRYMVAVDKEVVRNLLTDLRENPGLEGRHEVRVERAIPGADSYLRYDGVALLNINDPQSELQDLGEISI